MKMIKGEEKRSVAQKVRMLAVTYGRKGGLAASAATWRKLQSILGMDGIVDMDARLFHLADLIDPTCEMVVKNGHACCGRCGHRLADECEVEDDYYEFRPFCPDCGARVVRDDD